MQTGSVSSDPSVDASEADGDAPSFGIPRGQSVALGVCAAVCLMVPFILWLTGSRSEMLENRAPTEMPELSWSAVSDGSYFSQLETKMVETFPWRTDIIEDQAKFRWNVLGDSPNPDKVLLGRDDWMFYRRAVLEPCHMGDFVEPTVAEMLRVSRMAYAMGADPLTVVPPVKQAIYPEQMTSTLRDFASCSFDAENRFRAALLETPFPRFVDAWAVLQQEKDAGGQVYWTRDTHWNSLGAAVTGAAIMDNYLPDANAIDGLEYVRTLPYRGDIAILGALQETEQTERWVLKRPKPIERNNFQLDYSVSDDASKVRELSVETREQKVEGLPMVDDLLLLGDSFRLNIREMLAAFAYRFQVVQWDRYQPSWLVDRVEEGATLVLQSVDRLSDRRYLDRDLGDHMTYAVVERFARDLRAGQSIDVDAGTADVTISSVDLDGAADEGMVKIPSSAREGISADQPQAMLVVRVGGDLADPPEEASIRLEADGAGVPDPQALSAEPIAPEGWALHRTSDGAPFAIMVIDDSTTDVQINTLDGDPVTIEQAWVITTADRATAR